MAEGTLATLATSDTVPVARLLACSLAVTPPPLGFRSTNPSRRMVQLGVVAILSVPPTVGTGIGTLTAAAVFAGVFTGVACSSVALSLQVYGQRRLSPSRAALVLLSEPVFAGIIGYWNGEDFGGTRVLGAVVILVGIGIAELAPGRTREDAAAHADLDRSVKG